MKRKIAIVLTALSIALCLVACGGRNDSSTVSESNTGRIEDRAPSTQQDARANSQSASRHNNEKNHTDSGFMNDMRDAANSAGDAIGDAGRAIGDAVTGQDTSSTGMTGTR